MRSERRHSVPFRAATLAMAGVILVGCATVDPNASPAERRLAEDSNHFKSTVAEGALAGALGGALIGILATGKLQGALIGGAAGAVAGTVAGYMVAQNNYQHAQTSDNLSAAIADARKTADDARLDANASLQIAAEARASASQLAVAYRNRQITEDQYRTQLAKYQNDAKMMQQVSKGLTEKAQVIRQNAGQAGPGGRDLSASANNIDAANRDIANAADQLSRILSTMPSSGVPTS